MENRVWKSFYTLYNKIKKFNSSEMSIDILKNELKKWLDRYLYLSKYLRKSQKVTPYIHVFVFHVPEMLRLHQFNINQFKHCHQQPVPSTYRILVESYSKSQEFLGSS